MGFLAPVIGIAKVIGGALLGGGLVGTIARTVLFTAAQIGLARLNKPSAPQTPPDQGLELTKRIRTDHPVEVLFGQIAAPGSLMWRNTRGTNNEYFEQVLCLSDYTCDSIVSVLGDGETLTFGSSLTAGYAPCTSHYLDANGDPCLWIRVYLGDPDQTADSELVSNYTEITSDFRGRGRTYAITRMKWDRDAFSSGEPQLLFELKGAPIYDPRLDSTVTGGSGAHRKDDPSTWEWSCNPALIAAQYMRGFYINDILLCGMGYAASRIPDADLIEAANECEEQISLAAGGTEDRYQAHGSFLGGRYGRNHAGNLTPILEAMDGEIDDGAGREFRILPGVERTPVGVTVAWDDICAQGSINLEPDLEPADKINTTVGHFTDPAANYENGDIPLRQNATYLAEDGGQEYVLDQTYLCVTSATQGQRIQKRRMEKARNPRRVSLTLPLEYARLQRGDRVSFDATMTARLRLPDTYWRVEQRPSITPDLMVEIIFREYPDSIGEWSTDDELTRNDNTFTIPGLPDMELSGVSVSAVEIESGFARVPIIRMTWTAADPRIRVLVNCIELDGASPPAPVSPTRGWGGNARADEGTLDIQVSPDTQYKVQYVLQFEGRYSPAVEAEDDITSTGNLEPTGVNGVSAGDIAAAADDGLLTPSEKNLIVPYLTSLITEYDAGLLTTRAAIYSVSSSSYSTAMGALDTYLDGLTSPVAWNNITGNTTIVGSTWISTIEAAVEARDALLDAIETASGRNNVLIDGSGRFQGGGGGNGTYINNGLININADGSWTNGAGGSGSVTLSGLGGGGLAVLDWVRFGTNVRGSDGLTVIGDSDVFNSEITIDPDGTLNGGGGGQVTFSGLGGGSIGLLNSINNSHWSGTALAVANGGTGATTPSGGRTNLGLGGLAVLDDITLSLVTDAGDLAALDTITLSYVSDAGTLAGLNSINNSHWSGTALAVANGGTGATTESGARTALGLGGLAVLNEVGSTEIASGFALNVTNAGTPSGTGTPRAVLDTTNGALWVDKGDSSTIYRASPQEKTGTMSGDLDVTDQTDYRVVAVIQFDGVLASTQIGIYSTAALFQTPNAADDASTTGEWAIAISGSALAKNDTFSTALNVEGWTSAQTFSLAGPNVTASDESGGVYGDKAPVLVTPARVSSGTCYVALLIKVTGGSGGTPTIKLADGTSFKAVAR